MGLRRQLSSDAARQCFYLVCTTWTVGEIDAYWLVKLKTFVAWTKLLLCIECRPRHWWRLEKYRHDASQPLAPANQRNRNAEITKLLKTQLIENCGVHDYTTSLPLLRTMIQTTLETT